MSQIFKTVNIKADIPIKNITPPIYGIKTNIKMNLSDILKCLCRRAIIEEVLSDGSTVRLTQKNFREDFEGQLQERLKKEAVENTSSEVVIEETVEEVEVAKDEEIVTDSETVYYEDEEEDVIEEEQTFDENSTDTVAENSTNTPKQNSNKKKKKNKK